MEIKSLSDFDKKISDFFEKIKNFTSKKSETKLKEKDVSSDIGKELFEDFGLIGGSFAVLVKGTNEPLLLYNTEIVENADINNSDYFWFPYTSIFEVDQALNIDKSFAGVRSLQGLNESPPEFLLHLNSKTTDEKNNFQTSLYTENNIDFNSYPILYCDAEEVAIFCLIYILLLEQKDIKVDLENKIALKICENDTSFFNFIIHNEIGFYSFWKKLDIELQNAVLNKFVVKDKKNLKETLKAFIKNEGFTINILHEKCRFPIIPYVLMYWFNDKDKFKPAHLVKPVWFSLNFQPNIKGFENEDKVIFALLTVNESKFKFTNNNVLDNKISHEFRLFSRLINKLGNIVADTVFYSHFTNKAVQQQATRAAISQVMARNTSHNIGAHVMNNLIGDLGNMTLLDFQIDKNNYQSNFQNDLKILYKEVVNEINANEELNSLVKELKGKVIKHKILLEQIAIFNNYVKCRMDYLADISFGTPLMQTNKKSYGELFKDLDKVRLLLEHISGLGENFKYEIVFQKNGVAMCDNNDLLVAIPNDVLGMQAFYNIIENIIRNTAKHGKNKPDKTTFTVNFIDEWSEDLINHITDNNIKEARKIEQQNILNDFIAVEVYDNVPVSEEQNSDMPGNSNGQTLNTSKSKIDELVESQNKRINHDILEEGSKLRSTALGVIEMDASAAYLRKRDVAFINHNHYDVLLDDSWSAESRQSKNSEGKLRGTDCRNFLKAFKKENVKAEFTKEDGGIEEKEGPALGYRFFLLRPEVVLVVTDIDLEEERKKELKKQGIWIESKEGFQKHLEAGKVYNHEFVVYEESEEIGDLINRNKTSLPLRILNDVNIKDDLFVNTKDDNKNEWLTIFEDFCWEKWRKNNYEKIEITNGYKQTDNPSFQAVFLDHLYNKDGNLNKDSTEVWKNHRDANYVEALSSVAQSKMPDFRKIVQEKLGNSDDSNFKFYVKALNNNLVFKVEENKSTYSKLSEAILNKVVVIDERIQEAGINKEFSKVKFCELYEKAAIIVPSKSEINLSENSYSPIQVLKLKKYLGLELNKSEEELGNQIEDNTTCIFDDKKITDFVLIHYSILERMFPKDKINVRINELVDKGLNVVITSGRGVPDKLTSKARFVNLSAVIQAFVEIRSKYVINYLLNSSRKTN